MKERLIALIEQMDEAQLLRVEEMIDDIEREARTKRQLEALRKIAGIITDPEEVAALEDATRRRPFFGNRELGKEPGEKEQATSEEIAYGS